MGCGVVPLESKANCGCAMFAMVASIGISISAAMEMAMSRGSRMTTTAARENCGKNVGCPPQSVCSICERITRSFLDE